MHLLAYAFPQGHTTCVTEHEKYALGATKPGGYAAQGFNHGKAANGSATPSTEATGLEFLATRPPWACSVCNVNCTSRETLEGHAAGAKHKRRVRPQPLSLFYWLGRDCLMLMTEFMCRALRLLGAIVVARKALQADLGEANAGAGFEASAQGSMFSRACTKASMTLFCLE